MRQETTPSSPKAHTEPLSGCCNLKGTRRVLLAAQEQTSGTAGVFERHRHVECDRVGTGPVALKGVPYLRHLPFEAFVWKFACGNVEHEAATG